MEFKKLFGEAQTEIINDENEVGVDVEVFTVGVNKTYMVLSIELTSLSSAIAYVKQQRNTVTKFKMQIPLSENDYSAFTVKQIYNQGDSLVLNADSKNVTIAVHYLVI